MQGAQDEVAHLGVAHRSVALVVCALAVSATRWTCHSRCCSFDNGAKVVEHGQAVEHEQGVAYDQGVEHDFDDVVVVVAVVVHGDDIGQHRAELVACDC